MKEPFACVLSQNEGASNDKVSENGALSMSIFDVLENGIDAADVEPLDLRYFLTLDINIAKRLFLTRFMLHTSSTRFVLLNYRVRFQEISRQYLCNILH